MIDNKFTELYEGEYKVTVIRQPKWTNAEYYDVYIQDISSRESEEIVMKKVVYLETDKDNNFSMGQASQKIAKSVYELIRDMHWEKYEERVNEP